MAVLITGGAGYLGSHTCVELLNANYEIVVLDNFSNSKPEAIKRIREITGRSFTFYPIDLLDEDSLDKVFKENDIEAVIHFAGLKAVGESVDFPLTYYSTNIISTLATVYGTPVTFPISEEGLLGALNSYGRTKLMIEEMLKDLYQSDNDWSISILRYFNPVGAHYSGLIGEDPNGIPNNLMPYITQVAIGKLKELNVFGDKYPTADGTGIRDYIHVVDLALGHLRALERATFSSGVEVYNQGLEKDIVY